MKVLQVLPELNSGGVERGTVDFARYLVQQGHESLVISAGGRMVSLLEQEGSAHIQYPVHKKSLSSLWRVRGLRRLLLELEPDVIHVRSRIPAWMVWLALKKIPTDRRPALISTFHGLYSVSAYSAIMGCGDRVIAISQCVKEYILKNYPKIDSEKIELVHRGVDTDQFNKQHTINPDWQAELYQRFPQLRAGNIILMPGRLSRWKGHIDFIQMIRQLVDQQVSCHGLIVGSPNPGKEEYLQELQELVTREQLQEHITFLGHSDQMANLYALSSVVCNLSQHAEPFGRTVIEALAIGTPVVSYDYGGPAESLGSSFPGGLVPVGDQQTLCATVARCLNEPQKVELSPQFTLQYQARSTLAVYHKALSENLRYQKVQAPN